jgi:hypothetical protein
VLLVFGLQGDSLENGSFLGFGWRLLGILGPKFDVGLWRLLAMRKARIWQAFLIEERKFSENKTAWLWREDSNRDMANWKSDAFACPRKAKEPHPAEVYK